MSGQVSREMHAPSTVKSRRVLSQLEEDLLHLKRSRERLNEYGSTDRAVRHADVGLREVEDVVPETCLLVVLHLGKIKVRTRPACDELLCIVEEVESKVEDGRGYGGVVDGDAWLVKMPSAWAAIRLSVSLS